MASISGAVFPTISKYKISRRGRKLQATDDQRTLVALPKDVPERTWAEVLQKEDNDLFIFEIREDIVEGALKIAYEHYMERQTAPFTAHCAAQAWLKLIDWHFYRHDPGEEPSAYPPCFIPKRAESWVPDELPDPSPKDAWCKQELNILEDTTDETLQKWPSSHSLDLPIIENIPSEYWQYNKSPQGDLSMSRFPGKINVPDDMRRHDREHSLVGDDERSRKRPLVKPSRLSGVWESVQGSSSTSSPSAGLGAESELLQKVTDYSTEDLSPKDSNFSALKTTTPVDGSLHGAGDSVVDRLKTRRRHSEKSKVFSKASVTGRSRAMLPPLDMADSRSRISIISDCRLRNLRLDTQYEISSEKVDTPPGEPVKRK